jgi:hypothetical protein
MSASCFTSLPSGLSPEQRLHWTRRQHVADCAVEFLAAHNKPLDSPIFAHLQHYVSGEISLGQAIGRILDYLARKRPELSLLNRGC